MKNMILFMSVCFVSVLSSGQSLSWPSPDEMKANFAICKATDSTWYSNFGQYVRTFDLNEATKACNQEYPVEGGVYHPTGCDYNDAWIWAGYYCTPHTHH